MSHWKSAIPIILAAALGLVAAWTPLSLGTGRLHVDPVPSAGLTLDLSEPLLTPADLQERGVATLSGMYSLLASGALIATFTALVLLAIARASARRDEILVHRAVGASRSQLLRRGASEGMLMAFLALIVGAVLGLVSLQYAQTHWPGTVDAGRSLLPFVIAGAIGATIVLGIVIPLRSLGVMRPHLPPLTPILAPAICALQVAVCFAVLVQSRQVLREGVRLTSHTQLATGDGQIVALAIPGAPVDRARQLAEILRRTGASVSSPGTLQGVGTANMAIAECGNCSQGTIWTPLRPVAIALNAVSADTFHALHAHLIEGRWIADTDDWHAPRVAVISQGLARQHFENGQPLGRAIQLGQGPGNRFMVVGVVADPVRSGLGVLQPAYTVYTSVLQVAPTAVELFLHSNVSIVPRALIHAVLPHAQWRARLAAPVRWFGASLLANAIVVALIALLGITTTVGMWVAAMQAELAVHRAVGARRRDVLLIILRRCAKMITVGLVLGVVLALLSADPLSAIVPGVQVIGSSTIVEVALAVIAATGLASSVPAWRACRRSPLEALAR